MTQLWSDIVRNRIALLVLGAWFAGAQLLTGTICPFQMLFHINCPGCGLTRGCLCILSGQWQKAWAYNPSAFLWLPFLALLVLFRYVLKKSTRWAFPVAVCAGITSLLQWVLRLTVIW